MVTVLGVGLDWFRVTRVSQTHHATFNAIMAITKPFGVWLRAGGFMGYESSYKWAGEQATLAYSERDGQGAMIDLSGGFLKFMRGHGFGAFDIVMSVAGNATRIDVAIDLQGEGLNPFSVVGKPRRKGVKQKVVVNPLTGECETYYIGSRSSEIFVRVYDKGIQTRERRGGEWIRVEFECKGLVAQWVQRAILESGIDTVAKSLLSRQFADSDDLEDIMKQINGEVVDVEIIRRKETDTELWLLQTVAKTVARATRGNEEFWDKFVAAVQHFWEAGA